MKTKVIPVHYSFESEDIKDDFKEELNNLSGNINTLIEKESVGDWILSSITPITASKPAHDIEHPSTVPFSSYTCGVLLIFTQ